jgi:hypothetical protein
MLSSEVEREAGEERRLYVGLYWGLGDLGDDARHVVVVVVVVVVSAEAEARGRGSTGA